MYLDDKVPLDIAIIYLKLDQLETTSALTTLISYANHLGLVIYFDNPVEGYNSNAPIDETFSEDGQIDKLMICNDTTTIKQPKSLSSVNKFPVLFESNYYLSVFSFNCDEIKHYMVDVQGLWLESSLIGVNDFYVKKGDLESFRHSMENPSKTKPKINPYDDSPAVLTALALLSKSYADKSPSFKHGTSVNASAIKTEILRLAVNYCVPVNGLKKIDDKISSKIKELELNENSKLDNSK